jgi:hypothetical protein
MYDLPLLKLYNFLWQYYGQIYVLYHFVKNFDKFRYYCCATSSHAARMVLRLCTASLILFD